MEADFSLEMGAQRIHDSRSRDLFREVLSSYERGNYRSAVVMLWSVVVCDLLYKLSDLRDIHGDLKATAILTEIEAARLADPHSPKWEWKLVDEVKKRTFLLDDAEVTNFATLQQHRHLSAHPVLTATYTLYVPNRETTRAHLRNALEGLLCKPPILTREVFDALLEDLEGRSGILVDDSTLARYLEATYFNHPAPALEDQIFRSLWGVVFRAPDARANANREINYRTLLFLYTRRPGAVHDLISKHRAAFSNITASGGQLEAFLRFLSDHPVIFPLLTNTARVPIEQHLAGHPEDFATAWYMSASVSEHIDRVVKEIIRPRKQLPTETCRRLIRRAELDANLDRAHQIAIALYVTSPEFDVADSRFSTLIRARLSQFEMRHLTELLEGIEDNNQTYERWYSAKRDHQAVKARIDAIRMPFDPKAYPHFSESIGLPHCEWYTAPVIDEDE